MINRILIRIKVVQMLYSYLLTRNDFKLSPEPDGVNVSNDKRFAYEVYLDLLTLLFEIAGIGTPDAKAHTTLTQKALDKIKVPRAIAADSTVRQVLFKHPADTVAMAGIAPRVSAQVEESAVFGEFRRKRNPDLSAEVTMWLTVVEDIFANSPAIQTAMRALPGYSSAGYAMGVEMLADTLRSYFGASAGYHHALKQLEASLDKAYDLYISMMLLIVEITREQERRIENARAKHLATPQERNPDMRFVNNALAAKLAESDILEKMAHDRAISWATDTTLINALLGLITASNLYQEYMQAPSTDFARDCEFWRNALKNIVFTSDDLAEALEDKSVFWNDDLPIMGTFVLKTLRQIQQNPDDAIAPLPQYKDDEDAAFGAQLFVDAVRNRETYRQYIQQFIDTGNWDPERTAFMDFVIMMTAISELVNYPNIPLAVTMNEYVEIANSYSTAKSGQFVNGILFSVAQMLRQEGKIAK